MNFCCHLPLPGEFSQSSARNSSSAALCFSTSMTSSVEQLQELFGSLTPEVDEELECLFNDNPDLAVKRLAELAAQKGIQASTDEIQEFLSQLPDPETTVSLDQFKSLRQSITPEVEQQITTLIMTDYEAGAEKIVEVASAQGVTIQLDEVDILLDQLNAESDDNEEEDVELDAVALTAVAGGRGKARKKKQTKRKLRHTWKHTKKSAKHVWKKTKSWF